MSTKKRPCISPVIQLEDLTPYSVEDSQFEVKLKLDANEGPPIGSGFGTSNDPTEINEYPDRTKLEELIAAQFNLERRQVIVTAGGDEAIDRICRAYLSPGRNMIFPTPSFEMIRKYALMTGCEVRIAEWNGRFPVDQIVSISDEHTFLVSVVSPNNPTGQVVAHQEVARLAESLPDSVLLIDQAYAEFEDNSESESLTEFALREIPNGVVVRTFSKAWGMAGLRIGYALGPETIIDNLRKVGGPFPVSSHSLSQVERIIVNNTSQRSAYVERSRLERTELTNRLRGFGCTVTESAGNFVFAQFDSSRVSAGFVGRALAAQGILVRQFRELNALRITCPGHQDAFDFLMQKLEQVLSPKAVLFDMDGVLVDETPSYREAIRATCKTFGCEVSMPEIAEKKLLGDANNDWVFTKRLLSEHGIELGLDEVRERFEDIYQGNGVQPGLWDREQRLVNKEWLRSLADRYPLGIVTGRPRNDAVRFLKNEGLQDCFGAIVCMEDGPAKPNPDNVVAALDILEVNSAWMIGDTPDDVGAAVKAGIVGVGIVAPNDSPDFAKKKLLNHGAATIVDGLDQFGEMLP